MKKNAIAFAVLLAASGPAAGGEYFWPSEVLALPAEVAATGGVVSVRGIVTFMSGLEPNRFVVAPEDHPNLRGVEVVSSAPCEDLTCGAIVLVSGKAVERNGAVSLDATSVNILRVEEVKPPPSAKQADYRRGLLDGRVNELEVEVTNLGANRLRWNDLNKVDWKYFTDINIVDIGYKKFDASRWNPLPSGLLGPVRISVR